MRTGGIVAVDGIKNWLGFSSVSRWREIWAVGFEEREVGEARGHRSVVARNGDHGGKREREREMEGMRIIRRKPYPLMGLAICEIVENGGAWGG